MLLRFILGIAIGFVCWIVGSLYPAPPELLARLHAQALAERVQRDLQVVDVRALRGSLGEQRFDAMAQRATTIATAAGSAVAIERSETVDTSEAEAGKPSASLAAGAEPNRGAFEATLDVCPRMTVTNAPAQDAAGRVARFRSIVNVNGVALAVNPTHNACLSSGFGQRGSSQHKGVDYHNPDGGPIMAAADGVIVEMKYRDDYGNMILVDHGHGVYTRYCHLSAFQRGLAVGSQLHAGDQIGLMGNTASYPLPVHLHYELLLGDYNNPRASFGLTPHSPFEYLAAG